MAAETTVTRSPGQSTTTGGNDDVEEEREAKKMRTNPASMEIAASDDGDEELEISSPLREPYIPGELDDPYRYPGISAAYDAAIAEFYEKQGRVNKLPTRKYFDSPVLPIRDPARKAALSTARSLLRLSSSLDGEPLGHSTGLWIDWDEDSRTGIILTTAHLIRAKKPSTKDYRVIFRFKDRYQYHPGAQVTVHLLDDTTAEGHLLYHQEHYNIAFFKVAMERRVQPVTFADTVHDGQETMRLGREENLNLKIIRGTVEFENNPIILDEGHHYMRFSRFRKYAKADNNVWRSNAKGFYFLPRCDDGGDPIIDFGGKVVGMTNRCGSWYFVPSSVLNRCIDLWRNFGCIPRPLLGLQFEAIKFLDPTHAEYIWRKLNIDDGLVVEEVSTASHAEEVGIRVGDIIQCINEECVSTTTELENKLLSICRGNFDRGAHINAKVDVSVRVFHTANHLWRTQHLSVNVSDCREVVERAYYPITNGEGFSAAVSPEQVDSDSDSDSE